MKIHQREEGFEVKTFRIETRTVRVDGSSSGFSLEFWDSVFGASLYSSFIDLITVSSLEKESAICLKIKY
jgi:hypothetical protein